MTLKTDFMGGGVPETATQINARNARINANSGLLSVGSTLVYYQVNFYSDHSNRFAYRSGTLLLVRDGANGIFDSVSLGDTTNRGVVILGNYIYTMLANNVVKRVNLTDLSVDTMTASFMGVEISAMTSDGIDLFFTKDAGNDATNDHEIRRASISGTTLTSVETLTFGSTAGLFDIFCVTDEKIYSKDTSSPYLWRKWNRATKLLEKTSGAGASYFYPFNAAGNVMNFSTGTGEYTIEPIYI